MSDQTTGRSYGAAMPTAAELSREQPSKPLSRTAVATLGPLVALLLGGCAPLPPGFVVVGRDSHGTLVGGMVVCSDAPDSAVLTPTSQIETNAPHTQARWQFKREALKQGHLVTWPLFGPSTAEPTHSVTTLMTAPGDSMSLYVQRQPANGASGIDFNMAQLNALPNSQFLFSDRPEHVRAGTQSNVQAAARCEG